MRGVSARDAGQYAPLEDPLHLGALYILGGELKEQPLFADSAVRAECHQLALGDGHHVFQQHDERVRSERFGYRGASTRWQSLKTCRDRLLGMIVQAFARVIVGQFHLHRRPSSLSLLTRSR